MSAEIHANGAIRRIDHGDIMVNLFLGNGVEDSLANIHLRRMGDVVESIPLIGPGSPAVYQFDESGMIARGKWKDLVFRLRLILADSASAWFWHVEVENQGAAAVTIDLIHTQDLALAHYGAIRLNEYYVSQYVDHTALEHAAHGAVVASRQNQSMGGRFPWTMIGSLARAVSYATDALQVYGLSRRDHGESTFLTNGLAGSRLQHEHSMVAIQDESVVLESGAVTQRGFVGWLVADKPSATTPDDVTCMDDALALAEAICPPWPDDGGADVAAASLFTTAELLAACELDDEEIQMFFGKDQRHAEVDHGRILSFFTGRQGHVVLKEKELRVLRPHGHLLRTGGSLVPDESALTSTAWMGGVFHSMVTQGHVSINRFLSTCHTYLGLFRSHGQRVFVETDDGWLLLGVPSAFEMRPEMCRWIYKHSGGVIEVVASAADDRHELRLSLNVMSGKPSRFLISNHVAINGDDGSGSISLVSEVLGWRVLVRAIADSDVGRRFPSGGFMVEVIDQAALDAIGGDEMLFADGVSRSQPFLCVRSRATMAMNVVIRGCLLDDVVDQDGGFWDSIGGGLSVTPSKSSVLADAAARTSEIFPWLIHNALVHYLSPRGLEQYSGGGWGTRDVCQGPVELLLALGKFEPVRDLLVRVFRQQNIDGDWPQWFMFFERERLIRPSDSHGDIVYWPVLALAQYLLASGDASLLDEVVPYFHHDGDRVAEKDRVLGHVDRALELITQRVIGGTVLAAYGHGDWNDSLQPAKADMREHLCSSWTVTLNYQTFVTLAAAFRLIGQDQRAATLDAMAEKILNQFQETLVIDDVITGLAYFHEDGRTDHLIHPRDTTTGLSFSLLPMIHAIINDMLTPAQASHHLSLITNHLTGPDGARLFDRPMAYHGGIQTNFQRAESASYFGREIGIMYTHAHIRYSEALARFGDARAFFHALTQINPIAIREVVPSATLRQANCYYSSSDALFSDRYQAFDEYDKVQTGDIALEGGWRVYSSGAGIAVRLIMQCFLGLRVESAALVVDPVIPPELNGLSVHLDLVGYPIEVIYQCGSNGTGPQAVTLNGASLAWTRETNRYRAAGVRIPMSAFIAQLTPSQNRLLIELS